MRNLAASHVALLGTAWAQSTVAARARGPGGALATPGTALDKDLMILCSDLGGENGGRRGRSRAEGVASRA